MGAVHRGHQICPKVYCQHLATPPSSSRKPTAALSGLQSMMCLNKLGLCER